MLLCPLKHVPYQFNGGDLVELHTETTTDRTAIGPNFRKAAEILRDGRWLQGAYWDVSDDPDTQPGILCCAQAALNLARGISRERLNGDLPLNMMRVVVEGLRAFDPLWADAHPETVSHTARSCDKANILPAWNDADCREAAEVIALFELIADADDMDMTPFEMLNLRDAFEDLDEVSSHAPVEPATTPTELITT